MYHFSGYTVWGNMSHSYEHPMDNRTCKITGLNTCKSRALCWKNLSNGISCETRVTCIEGKHCFDFSTGNLANKFCQCKTHRRQNWIFPLRVLPRFWYNIYGFFFILQYFNYCTKNKQKYSIRVFIA